MAEDGYIRRQGRRGRDQDSPDIPLRYDVGAAIPFEEFMREVYGSKRVDIPGNAHSDWYYETRGMTPQQFVQSPYSQWRMQPDGTVKYLGGPDTRTPGQPASDWINPTWIDQGGAGNASLKQIVKTVAPYLGAFTGVGAALGGLSSLGIPGIVGGEAAAGAGAGGAPFAGGDMLAQLAGGSTMTDFIPGVAANLGDAAVLQGGGMSLLEGGFPTLADMAIPSAVTPSLSVPGVGGLSQAQVANILGGGAAAAGGTNLSSLFGQYLPSIMNAAPGALMGLAGGSGAQQQQPNYSNAGALASAIKSLTGADVNPNTLGLIGNALSTGLGAYASNQQSNALERIANQARADRQPFLNDALDMLSNPDKFYQRPEVMGAVDASLRGLSAKVGNPINNPGALAQQAAYNTGLYNNALTSRANLGLGGQDLTARLQTNAAMSNNGLYNALGSGLGSMFSNQPNLNNLFADYLSRSL